MVQQLRPIINLEEDPSLSSRMNVGQLIAVCNASSGESDATLWPPWAPACMCTYTLNLKS